MNEIVYQLDPSSIGEGRAIFLIGILVLLLAAASMLQNYAAGVMWSLSFSLLLLSVVIGLGIEFFYVGVIATVLMLAMGMVVRFSQ